MFSKPSQSLKMIVMIIVMIVLIVMIDYFRQNRTFIKKKGNNPDGALVSWSSANQV